MDKDRPTLPRIGELGRRPDSLPPSSTQLSSALTNAPPPSAQLRRPNLSSAESSRDNLINYSIKPTIPSTSDSSSRPLLPHLSTYTSRQDSSSFPTQPLLPQLDSRTQTFPIPRQPHLPPTTFPPVSALSQLVTQPDNDRLQLPHSQPNPITNIIASSSRTNVTSIMDGAISKPKKLHREVEQNRRQRMSEQIFELRKWVSDPNGGKTDKVSVLQDAVTFVKEATKKIEALKKELNQALSENTQLRSFLSNTHPSPHLATQQQTGIPRPATILFPNQSTVDTTQESRRELLPSHYPHLGFSVTTPENVLSRNPPNPLTPSNTNIGRHSSTLHNQNITVTQQLPSAHAFYSIPTSGITTQHYQHPLIDSTPTTQHLSSNVYTQPQIIHNTKERSASGLQPKLHAEYGSSFSPAFPQPPKPPGQNLHESGREQIGQPSQQQQQQQQPQPPNSSVLPNKNIGQGQGGGT